MSSHTSFDELKKELPASVTRIGWVLLAFGLLIWIGGYAIDAKRSAFNTIISFLFLASIAGGAIFLVALEYIAGAVWSVPMRRVNEFLGALTFVVPFLAIPLLFNMHELYHWTHEDAVSADVLLQAKAPYLNFQFFLIRFIAVFVLWSLFYIAFTRNSRKQDTTGDQQLTTKNVRLAAVFLPVFAITLTVTAIDWAMSLEPHWYSTIYGIYYFSGTVLAAVAIATFAIVQLSEHGFFPKLKRDHFYSLGALMFAFVNFWAYIAFSQFLLIWYANLPEETFWFINRWKNGWEYVSVGLIIVQFAVPYVMLLTQNSKMDLKRLRIMALWILFAHLFDLYWLVMPTYSASPVFSWIELGFPVLLIGLILVVFSIKLKRNNLVPVGDPKLQRGLDFRL
ncbi:MAG: quinol:cytochrome C oxidoreductase [bacterium]